jgi:putative ABC transport system ATP-binding protein
MIGSPVLELAGVTKTYPGQPPVHALRSIDLKIDRGEMLAVVGPSGSGKSTLLHMMGTLDWPTSGTVRVEGLDIAALADREVAAIRARRIGFLFQQYFLSEHRTVLDNVADGLLYAGVPRRHRLEQARSALETVGLGERVASLAGELSGGQKQRVALARALVGTRSLILADEPTGALDSHTGAAVVALLRKLNDGGATIVIITHDLTVAAIAPRRVEILDGRITREEQS